MPNATARANARIMSDEPRRATPEDLAARYRWEAAYAEWLAAKAANHDPAAGHDDDTRDKAYDRLQAAERALIATPAPLAWALLQKIEFVEMMMNDEFVAGEMAYPTASLALAAVRTDFLAMKMK